MTTTKQITGEEARRRWFEGVLGWKTRVEDFFGHGRDYDMVTYFVNPGTGKEMTSATLPAIDKSLDLQEEWVWPELREQFYDDVTFIFNRVDRKWCCRLDDLTNGNHQKFGSDPTKAMAQLLAALEAMRK